MKAFVATDQMDPRDGGFSYTIPGEFVYVGFMCDTDANSEDPGKGGCGCGRAFAGVTSRRAATLAVVEERDISRGTYVDLITTGIRDQGWGEASEFIGLANHLADHASDLEVGTIVFRAGWKIGPYDANVDV